MARSALVVLIPPAEPVIHHHRLQHDPMASRGVPAHVTILHPFRVPVDHPTAASIEDLCRRFAPFEAEFASIRRFPGQVVYLAPEPSHAFSAIIRAFTEAFPDCPPYGGAHADPVPHLTVGSGLDEGVADSLEAALVHHLPMSGVVDRLTLLMEDEAGTWTVDRSWPLRTPA